MVLTASISLLVLASLVLACIAGALFLWQAARQQAHRAATMRRLGGRLPPLPVPQRERIERTRAAPLPLSAWARRLDLTPGLRSALLVFAPAPVLACVIGLLAGWTLAGVALLMGALLTAGALMFRHERVQRQLVRALPAFIDAMVRTIVLGQSSAAAFQTAVPTTTGPLRRALEHAQALVAAGMELDAALLQTARAQGNEALLLLASVMRMTTQYGGRVDQVLERVAAFLRDREEAEEEMAAVSAETRMSAWVLGTLPVAVTVMILFANASYLARMWNDPLGHKLLAGAFALEAIGAWLLYRLARLQ